MYIKHTIFTVNSANPVCFTHFQTFNALISSLSDIFVTLFENSGLITALTVSTESFALIFVVKAKFHSSIAFK